MTCAKIEIKMTPLAEIKTPQPSNECQDNVNKDKESDCTLTDIDDEQSNQINEKTYI